MTADYGDFEEVEQLGAGAAANKGSAHFTQEYIPTRVRLPRGREIIGTVIQRLGGNRMEVACTDGKTRNCRVPGRFKRSLWLRLNDVVMIERWEHDDGKGDVIYKYNSSEATQLRKRGVLVAKENKF
ncbi:MAG TPA: translation initiation factor eIF-1A [Candidatus Nanoarchaeia archaeon]|nr:translation initiation factor eIF-1A [Candidatus Nanoarchaeia archaeon]